MSLQYQFAAGVDADAQAAFKIKMQAMGVAYARMTASRKAGTFIGEAADDLAGSGVGAVEGAINTLLSGQLSLQSTIGLACATDELADVITAMGPLPAELAASAKAVGSVGLALGG